MESYPITILAVKYADIRIIYKPVSIKDHI